MSYLHGINSGTMPGVFDWYVAEDGIFYSFLNVNGVNYVYKILASSVGSDIKMYLSRRNEILGVAEIPEEEKVDVTPDYNFGVRVWEDFNANNN